MTNNIQTNGSNERSETVTAVENNVSNFQYDFTEYADKKQKQQIIKRRGSRQIKRPYNRAR